MEIQIEKAAEGVEFQEKELPLDINYSKLSEWLVSRKKLSHDWRKKIARIHSRIAKEFPKLPLHVDTWLRALSLESTGYFEILRIQKILSDSNSKSQNFFSRFTESDSWTSILNAYKKEDLFLGEFSQILIKNTNYEIPFLKKQLSKFQLQLSEIEKKESECKKNLSFCEIKYKQSCEDLGISGKNVNKEIKELVKELPNIFNTLIQIIQEDDFKNALNYYQMFVEFVHSQNKDSISPVLPTIRKIQNDSFPKTKLFAKNKKFSNDTKRQNSTFDFDLNSAENDKINPPVAINWDFEINDEKENFSENEKNLLTGQNLLPENFFSENEKNLLPDKNLLTEKNGQEDEKISNKIEKNLIQIENSINWDVEISEVSKTLNEISEMDKPISAENNNVGNIENVDNFVNFETVENLAINSNSNSNEVNTENANKIKWDIEIEEEDSQSQSQTLTLNWDYEIDASEVKACEMENGMHSNDNFAENYEFDNENNEIIFDFDNVRGDYAFFISGEFADAEFRNLILNEIWELYTFLNQRIAEMDKNDFSNVQSQLLLTFPSSLQQLTSNDLTEFSKVVQKALNLLQERKTKDILLIYSSPKFVDRLQRTLEQRKSQERNLLNTIHDLERRKTEIRSSISSVFPKLSAISIKTKEVKSMVEKTLSSLLDGRPVNIIGEINNLID